MGACRSDTLWTARSSAPPCPAVGALTRAMLLSSSGFILFVKVPIGLSAGGSFLLSDIFGYYSGGLCEGVRYEGKLGKLCIFKFDF